MSFGTRGIEELVDDELRGSRIGFSDSLLCSGGFFKFGVEGEVKRDGDAGFDAKGILIL